MGIAYNTNIVRDGLVLQLDAANIKSYPGSGATWYDLSGNAYNGTIFEATYDSANGAFVFDGVNDVVNLGNIDIVTSAYSIEVWFKGNTTQVGTYNSLISKDLPGNLGTFSITSDENNNYVRFGYNGTAGQKEVNAAGTIGATDIKANTWVCYCGTWDGSNVLSLYRNAQLIKTTTGANGTIITGNSSNLLIGDRTAADGYFGGSIASVKVYNSKTLTESEVKQNFAAQRGRYGL